MIRRLLTFLLVACLAVPAMAAPLHCGQQTTAAAMGQDHAGHHGEAPRHKAPDHAAPAAHDCIGCIAPLGGMASVPSPPLLPTAPFLAHGTQLILGPAAGPDTPPPRA